MRPRFRRDFSTMAKTLPLESFAQFHSGLRTGPAILPRLPLLLSKRVATRPSVRMDWRIRSRTVSRVELATSPSYVWPPSGSRRPTTVVGGDACHLCRRRDRSRRVSGDEYPLRVEFGPHDLSTLARGWPVEFCNRVDQTASGRALPRHRPAQSWLRKARRGETLCACPWRPLLRRGSHAVPGRSLGPTRMACNRCTPRPARATLCRPARISGSTWQRDARRAPRRVGRTTTNRLRCIER